MGERYITLNIAFSTIKCILYGFGRMLFVLNDNLRICWAKLALPAQDDSVARQTNHTSPRHRQIRNHGCNTIKLLVQVCDDAFHCMNIAPRGVHNQYQSLSTIQSVKGIHKAIDIFPCD